MITITLYYHNARLKNKVFSIPEGDTGLSWEIAKESVVGKKGIDELAADLLTIVFTIYHAEKFLLPSFGSPIKKVDMKIPVYHKNECDQACESLTTVLLFMNAIPWEFKFLQKKGRYKMESQKDEAEVDQVILFSGGMDSTCGLAAHLNHLKKTVNLFPISPDTKKSNKQSYRHWDIRHLIPFRSNQKCFTKHNLTSTIISHTAP